MITKNDFERYNSLAVRLKELKQELSSLTQEDEALMKEYADTQAEYDEIGRRISLHKQRLLSSIERIQQSSDGADLDGFDSDARLFFSSLYDYYESRKEDLRGMIKTIDESLPKKLSFIKRMVVWYTKWKIRKEIRRYTKEQRFCIY